MQRHGVPPEYAGLSHCASAATVRTSQVCSTGATSSRMASSARSASRACSRGSRYSDWSSSPLLGVNSARKCGSRSCQGPGTPNCSVQFTAGIPARVIFSAAGAAYGKSGRSWSVRRLSHTCRKPGERQSVNRLTLYAADSTAAQAAGVQRGERQLGEDVLFDLVGRLQVQGERGDHAQRAERGDRPVEPPVAPGQGHRRAVRRDQLDLADHRRQ
ncbi:hypothetical protein SFUMM280S_05111 [Streptomyces fumanus]